MVCEQIWKPCVSRESHFHYEVRLDERTNWTCLTSIYGDNLNYYNTWHWKTLISWDLLKSNSLKIILAMRTKFELTFKRLNAWFCSIFFLISLALLITPKKEMMYISKAFVWLGIDSYHFFMNPLTTEVSLFTRRWKVNWVNKFMYENWPGWWNCFRSLLKISSKEMQK